MPGFIFRESLSIDGRHDDVSYYFVSLSSIINSSTKYSSLIQCISATPSLMSSKVLES